MALYDKGSPYTVQLEAGDTAEFCLCGRTNRAPFCDSSHFNHPPAQPLSYEADEDVTLSLCGCGKSKKLPFCDGSHNG